MSSPTAEAFESLLDVQEFYLGRREKLLLNGSSIDFLVGDTNTIDAFVGGGIADSGSFIGMVRVADFKSSGAVKFSPFTFRGTELKLLNFSQINETIQVTGGDPTSTEA